MLKAVWGFWRCSNAPWLEVLELLVVNYWCSPECRGSVYYKELVLNRMGTSIKEGELKHDDIRAAFDDFVIPLAR